MRSDANNVAAGSQHFDTVTFSLWTQNVTTGGRRAPPNVTRGADPQHKISRVAVFRLVAGPCEAAGLLSWEGTWPLPGHLTEAPSAKDVHTFLTLWILEMHFFLLVPPSLLFTHFPINGLPQ